MRVLLVEVCSRSVARAPLYLLDPLAPFGFGMFAMLFFLCSVCVLMAWIAAQHARVVAPLASLRKHIVIE